MTIRQGGQAAATGGSAFGYSLLGTGQVGTVAGWVYQWVLNHTRKCYL